MKNYLLVIIGTLLSSLLIAGVVYATTEINDTLQVDALKVGKQGVGGVTYFNGTIVNETTRESGYENPVTFGDDVRIDGKIYRGELPSLGGPVVINDDIEITGDLTVNGLRTYYLSKLDNCTRGAVPFSDGGSYWGCSDYLGDRLDEVRNFVDCVGDNSEGDYIETDAWASCNMSEFSIWWY